MGVENGRNTVNTATRTNIYIYIKKNEDGDQVKKLLQRKTLF